MNYPLYWLSGYDDIPEISCGEHIYDFCIDEYA